MIIQQLNADGRVGLISMITQQINVDGRGQCWCNQCQAFIRHSSIICVWCVFRGKVRFIVVNIYICFIICIYVIIVSRNHIIIDENIDTMNK